MTTWHFVFVVAACALVTWLPRIIPFIIVKNMTIPPIVMRWLSYIPICILSALVIENLFVKREAFVGIDFIQLVACMATCTVAILTKSLAKTVVFGVAFMAVLRLFV